MINEHGEQIIIGSYQINHIATDKKLLLSTCKVLGSSGNGSYGFFMASVG